MKVPHVVLASLFLLSAACLPHALSQGDLQPPPGPPGPTMKTLDQVEARTIVNATNTPGDGSNSYIISLPGSYYLTSNLAGDSGKHGISIQASDVTLDLNGFALVNATPGVGLVRGVDVPAEQKNVSVRNGTVRLWNGGGVRSETVRNALVEKLRVSDCTDAIGIYVGLGSLVKDCVANANGIGIRTSDRCQVMNCVSTENSGDGFKSTSYVTIMDCTSSRNGTGIYADRGCSVFRSSVTRNIHNGIIMGYHSTANDCTAVANGINGIQGEFASSATNCTASENGWNGILAYKVDGCSTYQNGKDGIFADHVDNCVARLNGGSGITAAKITNCLSAYNGGNGVYINAVAPGGTVTNCRAEGNGGTGITANNCTITNSASWDNALSGIVASEGSITNCVAQRNGSHGIDAANAVVAFCNARANNQSNNGSEDLHLPGASHRTGNVPSP